MTNREKLSELLKGFSFPVTVNGEPLSEWTIPMPQIRKALADFLISNGATFAKDADGPSKWISVEDDLPKRSKYNFEEYIVTVCRSHWPTSSYDPVDAPYDEEYTTSARYDFDQKVWHLGWGEVVLNALLKPEDAPLNGEVVTHWMPLPDSEQEEY